MPRSKQFTSSLVKTKGELRLFPHRWGQLPLFPRVPRDLEQDTRIDTKSKTEPIKKLSFRKHQVQPHFDQRIEEHPGRRDERFRLYWRKSGQVKTEPVNQQTRLSPRPRINSVREPRDASTQHGSRTSEWLLRVAGDGTVVPKHLSRVRFPAGPVAEPTPQVPRKGRTNEDRANVEAVLITSIPLLTEYLSAEMIDMIRTSPFHDPSEDEVIIRSHQHRTRGQNVLGCFKRFTRLIRNVANEIVYREQRIAAEERMYREEGAFDDPETVILSPAESREMAWNLRYPFTRQLKKLRKAEKRKELSLKVIFNKQ